MDIQTKVNLKQKILQFLKENYPDYEIDVKLENVCGKTGPYYVPKALFTERTKRNNRVLLPWKSVVSNNLTYEQLNTFENGVVVEFLNNDYFIESNRNNPLFNLLRDKLGSDENVSSIISIHTEEGSSSSAVPRSAFSKLIDNTECFYKGEHVIVTEDNYRNYILRKLTGPREKHSNEGNDKWDGFIFVSIRGGQQDVLETHGGNGITLFNPACEYASEDVSLDINLVVSYYILKSITDDLHGLQQLIHELEECLVQINYDSDAYTGNLLDRCKANYSLSLVDNQLTDPIQLKQIHVEHFAKETERDDNSIDLTHLDSVNNDRFYWDRIHECLLSPARPDNLFWSFHLSNMMQQNFTLDEFFVLERQRVERRIEILGDEYPT